jgi:hypothetical protein
LERQQDHRPPEVSLSVNETCFYPVNESSDTPSESSSTTGNGRTGASGSRPWPSERIFERAPSIGPWVGFTPKSDSQTTSIAGSAIEEIEAGECHELFNPTLTNDLPLQANPDLDARADYKSRKEREMIPAVIGKNSHL